MRARSIAAAGALAAYIATTPAANLLVTHYGVVPVGFGQDAPAGVYMIGLTLVLRDLARELAGRVLIIAAMAVGAILSYWLATPELAAASVAAFIVAETLDYVIYEPLRRRGLVLAVGVSATAGLVADSVVFLWIAFGSMAYLPGQLLGKAWMTLAALVVVALWRRRWPALTPA
ncbi:VUT family protein [Kitasatospora cineracea]|uniref:VUT family protein n=1 Tax=Kitasatospora cineracea TaxID=88074 RepID=UPI0038137638